MTDTLSQKERSKRMSLIQSKDTQLELRIRKLIHSMGFRYRLHRSDLPGKPDLVFGQKKKIIFINGCFFHHHAGCSRAALPKSRRGYWVPKLQENARRDRYNLKALRLLGWKILTIWECQSKDKSYLSATILKFLAAP